MRSCLELRRFEKLPFAEQLSELDQATAQRLAALLSVVIASSDLDLFAHWQRCAGTLGLFDDDEVLLALARELEGAGDAATLSLFEDSHLSSEQAIVVSRLILQKWVGERPLVFSYLFRKFKAFASDALGTDLRVLFPLSGADLVDLARTEPARVQRATQVFFEALRPQPKSIAQVEAERLLAEHVYADSSRFIYELLQNADDAHATEFALQQEGAVIRVLHNGSPFCFRDVVGLLSIGQTTKGEGDIGFFGVGFKSVYAVTERPQLRSGPFHFEIARGNVPRALSECGLVTENTTILLPFKSGFPVETLRGSSARLAPETLLSLPSVRSLRIEVGGGAFHWRRQDLASGGVSLIDVETQETREYLVFRSEFAGEGVSRRFPVTELLVAFPAAGDVAQPEVLDGRATLYSFFATAEDTGLRFLVHARFELTVDRERLLADSRWNDFVLTALGTEAAHSIGVLIAQYGIAFASNFIPLTQEARGHGKRIADVLLAHLRRASVFPASNGCLYSPDRIRLWPRNLRNTSLPAAWVALPTGDDWGLLFVASEREEHLLLHLGARTLTADDAVQLLQAALRPLEPSPPFEWHGLVQYFAVDEDFLLRAGDLPLAECDDGLLRMPRECSVVPAELRTIAGMRSCLQRESPLRDLVIALGAQRYNEDDCREDALLTLAADRYCVVRALPALRWLDSGRWWNALQSVPCIPLQGGRFETPGSARSWPFQRGPIPFACASELAVVDSAVSEDTASSLEIRTVSNAEFAFWAGSTNLAEARLFAWSVFSSEKRQWSLQDISTISLAPIFPVRSGGFAALRGEHAGYLAQDSVFEELFPEQPWLLVEELTDVPIEPRVFRLENVVSLLDGASYADRRRLALWLLARERSFDESLLRALRKLALFETNTGEFLHASAVSLSPSGSALQKLLALLDVPAASNLGRDVANILSIAVTAHDAMHLALRLASDAGREVAQEHEGLLHEALECLARDSLVSADTFSALLDVPIFRAQDGDYCELPKLLCLGNFGPLQAWTDARLLDPKWEESLPTFLSRGVGRGRSDALLVASIALPRDPDELLLFARQVAVLPMPEGSMLSRRLQLEGKFSAYDGSQSDAEHLFNLDALLGGLGEVERAALSKFVATHAAIQRSCLDPQHAAAVQCLNLKTLSLSTWLADIVSPFLEADVDLSIRAVFADICVRDAPELVGRLSLLVAANGHRSTGGLFWDDGSRVAFDSLFTPEERVHSLLAERFTDVTVARLCTVPHAGDFVRRLRRLGTEELAKTVSDGRLLQVLSRFRREIESGESLRQMVGELAILGDSPPFRPAREVQSVALPKDLRAALAEPTPEIDEALIELLLRWFPMTRTRRMALRERVVEGLRALSASPEITVEHVAPMIEFLAASDSEGRLRGKVQLPTTHGWLRPDQVWLGHDVAELPAMDDQALLLGAERLSSSAHSYLERLGASAALPREVLLQALQDPSVQLARYVVRRFATTPAFDERLATIEWVPDRSPDIEYHRSADLFEPSEEALTCFARRADYFPSTEVFSSMDATRGLGFRSVEQIEFRDLVRFGFPISPGLAAWMERELEKKHIHPEQVAEWLSPYFASRVNLVDLPAPETRRRFPRLSRLAESPQASLAKVSALPATETAERTPINTDETRGLLARIARAISKPSTAEPAKPTASNRTRTEVRSSRNPWAAVESLAPQLGFEMRDAPRFSDFGFAILPSDLGSPWVYAANFVGDTFDPETQHFTRSIATLRGQHSPAESQSTGRVVCEGRLNAGRHVLPVPMWSSGVEVRIDDRAATSAELRVQDTLVGKSYELTLRDDHRIWLSASLHDIDASTATNLKLDERLLRSFVSDAELPAEMIEATVRAAGESTVEVAERLRDRIRQRYRYDPTYLEDESFRKRMNEKTRDARVRHLALLHAGATKSHLGAGVCYELNVLLCELLRRAGIPSVVVTGSVLRGQVVAPSHLWVCYFVSSSKGWMPIPLDAASTRQGRPLLSRKPITTFRVTTPDLAQRPASSKREGEQLSRSSNAPAGPIRPSQSESLRVEAVVRGFLESRLGRPLTAEEVLRLERLLNDPREWLRVDK